MKYDIYVTPLSDTGQVFGVEIQPPISQLAFEGLQHGLTQGLADSERDANQVSLTRDDAEGTAFIIERDVNPFIRSEHYAKKIGALIDPCNLHEINHATAKN